MPIATFINMLAVLLGGGLGLLLGNRLPERIKHITFQGIGLATLVIGMRMAFGGKELLLLIFALILGGMAGEWMRLEARANSLGEWMRTRLKSNNERFAEGLTTTFLMFCVGSMTIVGAINEGISGDRTLLLTKSVMDGFTAVALATVYGNSVLFSVVPMLIFQGGITLLAYRAQYLFNEALIAEMGAVGGVLILGIGINILGIKQIKVLNMLPALAVMVLLVWLKMNWPF